jgi:hypothetical protein
MFLIRTALIVGAAVLLLPTDEKQQARLHSTASYAVERATTFCDRNAQTCRNAGELWATFLKKAEFGGRLAMDLVNDQSRGGTAGQNRAAQATPPKPEPRRLETGTLKPADADPAWRGPTPRPGA